MFGFWEKKKKKGEDYFDLTILILSTFFACM